MGIAAVPRHCRRRLLPPALLLLVVCLAAAAPARAAAGLGDATAVATSPPQLLLIHGGSFLFDDPGFEALTALPAARAGFGIHYLTYPLRNLPAAVAAARAAARRLHARYGASVYAYGASAGGTLAALLAGDGLVSAAVAKAPPSDLLYWEWPLIEYGPGYYEEIKADLASRRRLSPLRRRARRPLLVIQGRGDRVVPPQMNEAFAEKFAKVRLWQVPGGHLTERERPWVLQGAMTWLADVQHAQESPDRPRYPRHAGRRLTGH